jgi:hypothetical protein
MFHLNKTFLVGTCAALALSACSGTGPFGGSLFGGSQELAADGTPVDTRKTAQEVETSNGEAILVETAKRRTVYGGGRSSIEASVQVNKYIWNAALDVLSFLPVISADPFTGVIITGYGTPPGGGTAYRAVINVTDPALDARSLNLSLQTRSGAASTQTTTAVEDAILTRARQLRTGK